MNVADAAYNTVHDYPGGASALGPRLGIQPSILNSKVNPNTVTHHLRLDEAVKIMVVTGDYRMHHAISRELGLVSIPIPSAATVSADSICFFDMMLELREADGRMSQEFRKALSDGRITPGEAIDLKHAIHELQQLLSTMNQCIDECTEKQEG